MYLSDNVLFSASTVLRGLANINVDISTIGSESAETAPESPSSMDFGFQSYFLVASVIVALKCALMDLYSSTDFEVHRNWMALTHNLPLAEWYRSEVSEWTLDYPPFFAYFEWILAKIASFVDSRMLVLQKEAFFSPSTLFFQRFSVIGTDLFYIFSCGVCVHAVVNSLGTLHSQKYARRLKFVGFVMLAANPALIHIDNIHFQYNSMLTAWLLISIAALASGRILLGAVFFSVLLNFKHLYLYYVPAYVAHYLISFLLPLDKKFAIRFVQLAFSVGAPLVLSFGPFLLKGGPELIGQIFSRLFPFHRGLTHAFWAPNFWALYNAADFVGFQLTKRIPGLLKTTPQLPQYTSGLVQEYSHSVLWNVSPPATLSLILVALTPVVFRRMRNPKGDILVDMVLCSYAFFLFGWHVHEKAILMISIPLFVMALKDFRYMSCSMLLSVSGYVSILSLFFTFFENCFKYVFLAGSVLLALALTTSTLKLAPNAVIPRFDRVYIAGLVLVELYKVFLHQVLFRDSMPFLPLMLTSIYCALGVVISYFRFLAISFESTSHASLKRRCIRFEESCKAKISEPVVRERDVRFVGGIDISTCKTNNSLAVVSYTVLTYPDLKVVHESDKVEFIPVPYVNNFLAMREAAPMANLIRECSARFPEAKADVLLVDANGRYHPRQFGLACHIGHLCGIPTIGVSKSFNLSPLVELGADPKEVKNLEKDIGNVIGRMKGPGYLPLPLTEPVIVHAVRTANSKVPVFVSVGYRIDLKDACEIVLRTSPTRIAQPIRMSDLRSRELVRRYY